MIQAGINDVLADDVVSTVRIIKKNRKKRACVAQKTRKFNKSVKLDAPIKKNKLSTFLSSNTKSQSAKSEEKELKIHV